MSVKYFDLYMHRLLLIINSFLSRHIFIIYSKITQYSSFRVSAR